MSIENADKRMKISIGWLEMGDQCKQDPLYKTD
jgi:hypothetical protein